MSSDDDDIDSGDGESVSSGEDEFNLSGDDDDEFDLRGILDDDAFDAPRCPNQECRDTNLHFSGSLSICVKCRSVQSGGATVSTTDAFPYSPLVEASELRLLLVWPPTGSEDNIHCTLIHGRLGTGVEYDAVSYTWADETGDDSQSKTVFVNDRALPVTATCKAVLKRIRLQSTAKVLWIDAVCINQGDTDERGHQVSLMPDIYSHAKKVLIFPGEATDDDSRGLYYLPQLETLLYGLILDSCTLYQRDRPETEKPARDLVTMVQHTIKHIFSRRYFTRVWILQEIALAKEPVVIYGAYEAPWNTIRSQITRSFTRYAGSCSYNTAQPLLPPDEPLPRALTLGTATVRGPSDLLDLLDKARNSQAHDARDKVFALFGMIPFASRFGLVADYNQTVEQAYAKVAVLLASQHGLLPILARTTGTTSRQPIASWVPDWSTPGWYKADKPLPKAPKWTMEGEMEPPDGVINPLANPTKIPVLARPNGYDMDCIGAWVCDLGTLLHGGLPLQVFTPTRGVLSLSRISELEVLYRALDLPVGRSLCCYLPMSPADTANYQDEAHLERELDSFRHDKAIFRQFGVANLFRQRRWHEQCELILSSGLDDFCFAGICVIAPFMTTRALGGSRGLGYLPNDLEGVKGRFLSKELVSLMSPHRRWADKVEEAPAIPDHSTAPSDQGVPGIRLGGLLAMATAGKRKGAIKSDPPGMLGGEDGWLNAWADRELRFLTEFLETAEGKSMLESRSVIWPYYTDAIYTRDVGVVDMGLDSLLGDDPLEFRRLTFKLRG